jgi:hypothetical protein
MSNGNDVDSDGVKVIPGREWDQWRKKLCSVSKRVRLIKVRLSWRASPLLTAPSSARLPISHSRAICAGSWDFRRTDMASHCQTVLIFWENRSRHLSAQGQRPTRTVCYLFVLLALFCASVCVCIKPPRASIGFDYAITPAFSGARAVGDEARQVILPQLLFLTRCAGAQPLSEINPH